jgi:hypothetical protein
MKHLFVVALLFIISSVQMAGAVENFSLNTEPVFSPTFLNRVSFLVGLNPSLTKAGDVVNFNASFAKKMEDYWLDTTFMITSGAFNKITTNNAAATGATDDALFDTKSTLTTFGVGVSRESRYSQTLLPFDGMFEVISADITYNLYKETTTGKSFTGPGIIAKFSLFKKFSDYVSMGPQLLYNLAVVKRAQDIDTETSSVRSLTMSYVTIGFDLSFYL